MGRRIELDWTLDARIVEEVEVRRIGYHVALAWNLFFSIHSHGQGGVVHDIVDGNRQPILASPGERIEFHLKRCKSAFVFNGKLPIEIDLGFVCHRTKPQHQALIEQMSRDGNFSNSYQTHPI